MCEYRMFERSAERMKAQDSINCSLPSMPAIVVNSSKVVIGILIAEHSLVLGLPTSSIQASVKRRTAKGHFETMNVDPGDGSICRRREIGLVEKSNARMWRTVV